MILTKVICTLGPASGTQEIIEKLHKAGMTMARLNFSHGNHEEHLGRIRLINTINKGLAVPISIILDTQGAEIRIGAFKEKALLVDGEEVVITTRDVLCDSRLISISYKKIAEAVKPGDFIYIADGTIELRVKKVNGTEITCEIVVGGEVNTRKNVGIPGAIIDLPSISEKDIEDIKFGCANGIDFVAQSFVKTAKDVLDMKRLVKDLGGDAMVIAKIECQEGLKNIDEIIKVSDAIMVARGDLGVQIPIEQVPRVQKMIIHKCNEAGKPVIVATQMLESMTKAPRPTRAEVTDIANAILDGADVLMLSGETAAGNYPVRSVEMMAKVARITESRMHYRAVQAEKRPMSISRAISRAVCQTASDLDSSAIITCTLSGHTTRMISGAKPATPIISFTPNPREQRKLNLWRGVHPFNMPMLRSTDELIDNSMRIALENRLVEKGDTVIITAGIPFMIAGNMNLMKVHKVE